MPASVNILFGNPIDLTESRRKERQPSASKSNTATVCGLGAFFDGFLSSPVSGTRCERTSASNVQDITRLVPSALVKLTSATSFQSNSTTCSLETSFSASSSIIRILYIITISLLLESFSTLCIHYTRNRGVCQPLF